MFRLSAFSLLCRPRQHLQLLRFTNNTVKRSALRIDFLFNEFIEQLIGQSPHELFTICIIVWPTDHSRRMLSQLLGIGLYAQFGVAGRFPESQVGLLSARFSNEPVVQ